MSPVTLRSPHDRSIARLAVPAFGTLLAEPLYVLADTAIVARLGTTELAGLALASTVLLAVHGVLIFLAYGTTAQVSRLIGAGDEARAVRVSVQALWLAAGLGVAIGAVLAITAEPVLAALGGSGRALEAGRVYLTVSTLGLPFMLMTLAGAGTFHGRQDTRTPLVLAVVGAALNLVIEVVLIFSFGFGIGASAAATVVAQAVTAGFFTWRVVAWATGHRINLSPAAALLRALLLAGRPLMLRTLALRAALTLATAVAARIGVNEVAAHQVALQVWGTLALALDAVAIAGQSLTGRWLGAGAVDAARGAARRMVELDVALGVGLGAMVLVLRHPIAQVFSNDAALVDTIAFLLVWVALTQPINGYVFALDGVLIGAGDLVYLGRTMAVVSLAFMAMAGAVMATGAGLGALWSALALLMVLRAIAVGWRWRTNRWIVTGAGRGATGGSG